MSTATKIEWTHTTWNPVTGCDRISPGCQHCYALTLAARLKAMGQAKYQRDGDPRSSGPGFGVTCHPDTLDAPLGWRKPRLVFVDSMSDLFHHQVPEAFIARVWATMAATPQHTYQVLTKRPKRARAILTERHGRRFWDDVLQALRRLVPDHQRWWALEAEIERCGTAETERLSALHGFELPFGVWALPNVWLGVSIETDTYTWRADVLRATPAAVRFASCEPLLGPLPSLNLNGLDWLITGGESGPQHRPIDPAWVRDLRDRCPAGGVAFFFKQWGGRTPTAGGRVLDGRTWDQMPAPVGQR